MSYALKPDITLHDRRCFDCGRYWAGEFMGVGACPLCADKRIDRLLEEQSRLERVVRSLRGAITRAKGKR